jgi:hypothetical protein
MSGRGADCRARHRRAREPEEDPGPRRLAFGTVGASGSGLAAPMARRARRGLRARPGAVLDTCPARHNRQRRRRPPPVRSSRGRHRAARDEPALSGVLTVAASRVDSLEHPAGPATPCSSRRRAPCSQGRCPLDRRDPRGPPGLTTSSRWPDPSHRPFFFSRRTARRRTARTARALPGSESRAG